MAHLCVICSITEPPPLMALSVELRQLLEALLAPVINIAELKTCVFLLCADCKMVMQYVHNFQQTALNGVRNLKLLLGKLRGPNTDKTGDDVITDLNLMLKLEPEPEVLIPKHEFVAVPAHVNPLSEDVTVKLEPELQTETDCDSDYIVSCVTDREDFCRGSSKDLTITLPRLGTSVPNYDQQYEEPVDPKARQTVKQTIPVIYVQKASEIAKVVKPSQLATITNATKAAEVDNVPIKTVKLVEVLKAANKSINGFTLTLSTQKNTATFPNITSKPSMEAKGTTPMTSSRTIKSKTRLTLKSILERVKAQRVQERQDSLRHWKQQMLQPASSVSLLTNTRKQSEGDRPKRIRKKVKRLPCPVCNKSLHAYFLRDHISRMHGALNPVSCNICGKVCRNESVLDKHVQGHKYNQFKKQKPKTIDDMRPELFCKECCISFSTSYTYKAHFQTLKHMPREQYEFECDTCSKMFPTKIRLQLHVNIVHLRKKEHKCGQCDREFHRRDRLREHVEITHEKRAKLRRHVCDICGKSFTGPRFLQEHLFSHQGLRPFECKLCPSTFTYSAALYTHNKLKHLKIKGNKKKSPEETQDVD